MTKKARRVGLMKVAYAAALAATATPMSQTALANVCVTCNSPDAAYSCVIEGASMAPDDTRAKLLCITELAKSGGHQSCAVSRAVTAPCPGEVRSVVAPSGDGSTSPPSPEAAAPAPTAKPTQERETTVPKSKPAAEGDVSETGEKDSAGSDEGAIEKAGKAVTDAAKSTWKCLSSFFGDC